MKTIVKLVAAVAIVAALVEVLRRRPAPPTASPTAPPNQWTPVTRGPISDAVTPDDGAAPDTTSDDNTPAWVEPADDGDCPAGYPVKAKTSSKIFHMPGGALYERTSPDRCYASAEAAEADGFRASQR